MPLGTDSIPDQGSENQSTLRSMSSYINYLLAVSKNIFPDGTQLAEKAKQIASRLGFTDFKASNGWQDRWKKRHNLKKMTICGESSGVTVGVMEREVT